MVRAFVNSMYVYVHWPTGIRIDQDGVRIGNVGRPHANRAASACALVPDVPGVRGRLAWCAVDACA